MKKEYYDIKTAKKKIIFGTKYMNIFYAYI